MIAPSWRCLLFHAISPATHPVHHTTGQHFQITSNEQLIAHRKFETESTCASTQCHNRPYRLQIRDPERSFASHNILADVEVVSLQFQFISMLKSLVLISCHVHFSLWAMLLASHPTLPGEDPDALRGIRVTTTRCHALALDLSLTYSVQCIGMAEALPARASKPQRSYTSNGTLPRRFDSASLPGICLHPPKRKRQ